MNNFLIFLLIWPFFAGGCTALPAVGMYGSSIIGTTYGVSTMATHGGFTNPFSAPDTVFCLNAALPKATQVAKKALKNLGLAVEGEEKTEGQIVILAAASETKVLVALTSKTSLTTEVKVTSKSGVLSRDHALSGRISQEIQRLSS
ncbi:MAG: hypothetical protein RDU59_04895 [Thermodesulfobacteriota bacterium]|nr:hypothetical protein [Thermodesulfobacteriota bacterium]